MYSLEKHKDAVTGISLSGDNNYLVSCGQDGEVHFWDAKVRNILENYSNSLIVKIIN